MRPLVAASVFLLLLIVLASPAWGQTDSTPNSIRPTLSYYYDIGTPTYHFGGTDTLTVVFDKDTLRSTNPYGAAGLYEAMRSWKEYKAECYADSTLERVHNASYDRLRYCLMDWSCLVSTHYRDEWTHRTPTFEGWMDWLERKLNRKEPTQ